MTYQKRFFIRFAVAVGLTIVAGVANAQAPAAAPLVVHPLATNIYWVEGGGGNSGVIVGSKA